MAKYEMLYLINNDLTDEAKEAKLAKYDIPKNSLVIFSSNCLQIVQIVL